MGDEPLYEMYAIWKAQHRDEDVSLGNGRHVEIARDRRCAGERQQLVAVDSAAKVFKR